MWLLFYIIFSCFNQERHVQCPHLCVVLAVVSGSHLFVSSPRKMLHIDRVRSRHHTTDKSIEKWPFGNEISCANSDICFQWMVPNSPIRLTRRAPYSITHGASTHTHTANSVARMALCTCHAKNVNLLSSAAMWVEWNIKRTHVIKLTVAQVNGRETETEGERERKCIWARWSKARHTKNSKKPKKQRAIDFEVLTDTHTHTHSEWMKLCGAHTPQKNYWMNNNARDLAKSQYLNS